MNDFKSFENGIGSELHRLSALSNSSEAVISVCLVFATIGNSVLGFLFLRPNVCGEFALKSIGILSDRSKSAQRPNHRIYSLILPSFLFVFFDRLPDLLFHRIERAGVHRVHFLLRFFFLCEGRIKRGLQIDKCLDEEWRDRFRQVALPLNEAKQFIEFWCPQNE